MIRAFVQARMSSARFPGKVLAPFLGKPLIAQVISRISSVLPASQIAVATSREPADDPLEYYVRSLGIATHRGAHENVFERFQSCLREYPCDWFFRICADSPLLDSTILERMLLFADGRDLDVVTNVQVRTFPTGHSVELIHTAGFTKIDPARLTAEEQEHVTKVYYNHPADFRILNLECTNPGFAHRSFVVDTVEDLLRLEKTGLEDQDSSSRRRPTTQLSA